MSGKKPSTLRTALREMRVNEPIRLSRSGPSFKPPESPVQDRKEVPLSEGPPSELPRSVSTQPNVAHDEPTQTKSPNNEIPQTRLPHIEAPPPELSQTEVTQSKPPQKERAHGQHPQSEQSHVEDCNGEPPQNEVALRTKSAQIELPQIEQSTRSFFRLSDRAFSYPQLQRLSGDGFRLFLWMSSKAWRYLKSDGTLRASVGFIEIHTAMSHATISRCLKTLREEALIQLLETDYKRGNVWSVSPVAFGGCGPEDLPPRSEIPQNEVPRNGASLPSKRDHASLNLRAKPPRNEGNIRSIKKYKNLSQEGAESLFARVEQVRAVEKQRTEKESLIRLVETHTPNEIKTALAYVDQRGTLAGEPCHSPFRYLATAIDDVLQTCQKKGLTVATTVSAEQAKSGPAPKAGEQQEEERKRTAFAAFENELTAEERSKFTSEFVAKEFAWGYTPSDSLATRLAAMQWYSERPVLRHVAG